MRKAKSLKRIVPSAECAILHTHNAYQGMKRFHPHEVVELLYCIKEKFLHNPKLFKFLVAKIRTLSIFLYTSNSECITIYAYYSRVSSSIGYK